MRLSHALAVLPFTVWSGVALAEPATVDGAAAITSALQTYLGATDGVVTVAPEGEAYGVKLDFTPLLSKVPQKDFESSVTPVEFQLVDQGDGTWKMTQDQAFNLMIKMPGELDLTLSTANMKSEGVFDVALQAFTTSSSTITDMSLAEKISGTEAGATDVHYHVDSMVFESTAMEGVNGGVDGTSNMVASGLKEEMALPPMGEGAPPTNITVTLASYEANATVAGYRPDALYKLVAFFVAHPDEASIASNQDEMKAAVTKALPFFASAKSAGTLTGLSVDTPMGVFAAATGGVDVEMNGLVADGLLREAFRLDGFTIPAGLVPDWAADLVPTKLAMDFKLTRFNLLAPVELMISAMDLTKTPPMAPEQDEAMLAALLPEGVVDVTLAPGGVTAPAYDLAYEGMLSAGPAGTPSGKARLTLTGIDKVQAALNAAPDDQKGQFLPMLGMAQGMAKPGDNGALVWELEMTPEGAMMVNGMNMGGEQ